MFTSNLKFVHGFRMYAITWDDDTMYKTFLKMMTNYCMKIHKLPRMSLRGQIPIGSFLILIIGNLYVDD